MRESCGLIGDAARCVVCDSEFKKKSHNQLLCSDVCRKKHYFPCGAPTIPGGTTGAISELMVSAELMRDGWVVFRGLSPCGFCDIVAVKNNEIRLIEVRSGARTVNGKLTYPSKAHAQATEIAVWVRNEDRCEFFPVTNTKQPASYMVKQQLAPIKQSA